MEYISFDTGRLRLKAISEEDLAFVYNHFSDNHVTKYLYDEEPVKNLEEAKGIIDSYVNSDPQIQCRWIVIDKITGAKIGTCGFHKRDDSEGSIDVGYDLDKAYWGKGYMSEALTEIITYAWTDLGVKNIYAQISELNIGSQRLVDKLCFEKIESYNIEYRNQSFKHFKYELSQSNWYNCSIY